MLSRKSILGVVVLFFIAVLLTGEARLSLDRQTEEFRNDFREMQYFPRGNSLKLLACGFDAPLADALFIKGMVYFGGALQDEKSSDVGKAYTYELFDVVTDLSPRFNRAYEVGSIFLTSSASLKTNLQGRDLLLKGVETFDKFAETGQKVLTDPRWLFHVLLANIYDSNIQPKYRRMNDFNGAAEARIEAAKHFRLAAISPKAPDYVIMAASGYERLNRGGGDIVVANAAVMAVWVDLYEQAKARGDKDLAEELNNRITGMEQYLGNIVETRQVQEVYSEAGKKYLAMKNELPFGVNDLVRAGLIAEKPDRYPLDPVPDPEDENADEDQVYHDFFWVLPDGTFRSNFLAILETNSQLDLLLNAEILYRRANRASPPSLDALVKDNFLDKLPSLPLAAMGQVFTYNEATGAIDAPLPYGPVLPEHLQ